MAESRIGRGWRPSPAQFIQRVDPVGTGRPDGGCLLQAFTHQLSELAHSSRKPEGFTDMSNHKERYGGPYSQVYRPDYHSVLLKAAEKSGANLRKGATVVHYKVDEGAVVLESGEIVRGHLVIGADGVKSIARKALGLSVEPHETGDTCFRVVLPREVLEQDPELAPLSRDPNFEQFLGPDHHIIGYNMQKERTFNLLMVIPDDRKMEGYKAPAKGSGVRNAYKGWSSM